MRQIKRRWLWILVGIAGALGVTAFLWLRDQPLDTRYNGAYRLDDGRLVFVRAREGRTLRYALMDGESRALWPVGGQAYEAGPDWSERTPVKIRVTFTVQASGRPNGLLWNPTGQAQQHATRLRLPETYFTFRSGELTLRGKLVTPMGPPPFPAVVIAQGSDDVSAVDSYEEPYLFASHGIACVVYDKRGTGQSQGRYTQNFSVLSRDLLAAVRWLRTRSEIDPGRIHLSGYSQGGWVAPLAAARDGHIRSILINYGAMVPVIDEDRWGYIYSLQHHGFGPAEIRKVDVINENVAAILDRKENRWRRLADELAAAKHEPWFSAVQESDSALGYLTQSRLPMWVTRLYVWWKIDFRRREPFIDRLYDPVPTAAALIRTPSLWIFGGQDHSIPTDWSVAKLSALRATGLPISIRIFPDADHGILRVEHAPGRADRILGYEPDYFSAQVNWLREQSGLPPVSPGGS